MTILQAANIDFSKVQVDNLLQQLTDMGISLGKHILAAVALFIVGRYVVKFLNRLFSRLLGRTKLESSVQTFLRSLVNILLMLLLMISVIGALGISTTSFAALLASAGVAVGMALSGNLQNFAGGLVILVFKPYRVGDWIETPDYSGVVKEIQIFHTILQTKDMRLVYAPNGPMSVSSISNVNRTGMRRAIWKVSLTYGCDVDYARKVLMNCLLEEERILREPVDQENNKLVQMYVGVETLGASGIDLTVRAYVNADDYWEVYYGMNEKFYDAIQADTKLSIPFNTQTLHIVKD